MGADHAMQPRKHCAAVYQQWQQSYVFGQSFGVLQVDWEGKKALIQCAKAMGIQRYIFFSIVDCDKAPDVPLMNIKHCTELYLKQVCPF